MARQNGARAREIQNEEEARREDGMKFSRHGKAFPWMIHACVERDRLNIHSVASVVRFVYAFPLNEQRKRCGQKKGQFRQGLVVKHEELYSTSFFFFLNFPKLKSQIS